MFIPTLGPARDSFPARDRVDKDLLEKMMNEGTIIIDNRRRRPLYFDGRFLAARDLTREQNYFLSRQADLGRAGGAGIVHGLLVSKGNSATSIQIASGHGVTSAGESIVLDQSISVELANAAEIQRLDAAFGISQIPSEPARNRSGLFVVALRPVEFTANPIASYPTSITGSRSVEDGDIVEGLAVTLVPYLDEGANTDFLSRRARVAREIFVNRATRGTPSAALPIAMIALDRGVIRWVDPFMVRREVGAEHGNTIGLSFAPRALREAHLFQYEAHLAELIQLRATRGLRFAASEHFQCLPPAGRLPVAAIDPTDFTQIYFPAEVDVDLSIVPSDEMPALVEESMLLPPIDLALGSDEQDSTSVQILIPIPRERLRLMLNSLSSLSRPLKPAAPNLVAKRKPLESLFALTLPRVTTIDFNPVAGIDPVWVQALGVPQDKMLWYVRRRNLQYKAEFVGAEVSAAGSESQAEHNLNLRLKGMGLNTRFTRLTKVSSVKAEAEMVGFLGTPRFDTSRIMMEGAIRALESAKALIDEFAPDFAGQLRLERAHVLTVEDRFANAEIGNGIKQLEELNESFKSDDKVIKTIADTELVPELDRIARKLPPDELEPFAISIIELVDSGKGPLGDRIFALNGKIP